MSHSPLQGAQAARASVRAHALRTPLVETPRVATPAPSIPELDAAIERFMLYAQDRDQSPLTVRNYRYSYRNFRAFLLDPSVGATAPEDRVRDLYAWTAWNRRRQVSRFTVNMHWRTVRAFFTYLEAEEGVPSPFRGAKTPGTPLRTSKALDAPDLRRILRAAQTAHWPSAFVRARSIAIVSTLMYTGIRKSELLNLTNGDVNLVAGWMQIVDGKGRFGGTSRVVPIPRALRTILAAYKAARAHHALGPGHMPEEEASTLPFFVSRRNLALSESQFRRTIATVRRLSGVKFSAHVLRHSFITDLVCVKGTPLPIVQSAVGHTSLETTAGYIRVRPEDMHAQLATYDI